MFCMINPLWFKIQDTLAAKNSTLEEHDEENSITRKTKMQCKMKWDKKFGCHLKIMQRFEIKVFIVINYCMSLKHNIDRKTSGFPWAWGKLCCNVHIQFKRSSQK